MFCSRVLEHIGLDLAKSALTLIAKTILGFLSEAVA